MDLPNEIAAHRDFCELIRKRFIYHLEDLWGWELALQRTSEDVGKPLFYVRRVIDRFNFDDC